MVADKAPPPPPRLTRPDSQHLEELSFLISDPHFALRSKKKRKKGGKMEKKVKCFGAGISLFPAFMMKFVFN